MNVRNSWSPVLLDEYGLRPWDLEDFKEAELIALLNHHKRKQDAAEKARKEAERG